MKYAVSPVRWASTLSLLILLLAGANGLSDDRPLGSGSRAKQHDQSAAAAITVPPIKVEAKAKLESDFLAQHRAWAKRVLVDPLAERIKGQPWADEAIAFADKGAQDLAVPYKNEQLKAVAEQGKKLVAAGCKDPLIVYLATRIHFRVEADSGFAIKTFDGLIKQIEEDKTYSRALLCFIGKDLEAVHRITTMPASKPRDRTPAWTQAAVSDGSYKPEDDAVFLRHQIAPQWVSQLWQDPAAWAKTYQSSEIPEWVRRTLTGLTEIQLGWRVRGGGFADTVTEEGWKGFGKHLAKARTELTAAWKLRPDRPEAATEMIEVAMATDGESDEDERLWFDRAITAQFDYLPAYAAMLRAYLPRWNGSLELMLAFGRACRDTHRYETEVPLQYLQAIHDIVDEVGDRRLLYKVIPGLAREVSDFGRALAEEPTRKAEKDDWLSFAAVQAWLGGEYETSAKILAELNGRLTPKIAGEITVYRTTPAEFSIDVELHTGKAGAEFDRASGLLEKHDFDGARTAFETVQKLASENAKPMIQSRLDVIDFERRLAGGDWVKVVPKPGLFEWAVDAGLWEAEADGTLVSRGSRSQSVILYRGRVGPNYELRGEFEAESSTNSDRSFGTATGQRESESVGVQFLTYQVGDRHPIAMVFPLKGGLPEMPKQKLFEFQPKNQFLLRVQNGGTSYEINGEKLFESDEAPPELVKFEDSHFGFTGAIRRPGNITRIRNIEVRRLP